MSVQKFIVRALALMAIVFAGVQVFSAFDADAHPHKRWRHRSHSSDYGGTSAREVEVQVTIHRLVALDKGDYFSGEDFFARVTIGGQVFQSERIRGKDAVAPNWRFAAVVPGGRTDVKIEVFDKDIAQNDPIDINRIDPKRDLDFVVNSRTCRIEGMSQAYRCGEIVRRAGNERKKAEMEFSVQVNRAN